MLRRKMALTPELVALCERVEPDSGPNPEFIPIEDADLDSGAIEASYRSASIHPLVLQDAIWIVRSKISINRREKLFLVGAKIEDSLRDHLAAHRGDACSIGSIHPKPMIRMASKCALHEWRACR